MRSPDPQIIPTTPPTGNTQSQVLLMGQRGARNGQPVTAPVALAPSGAIMVTAKTKGVTGIYKVRPGDVRRFVGGVWLVDGVSTQRQGGMQLIEPPSF